MLSNVAARIYGAIHKRTEEAEMREREGERERLASGDWPEVEEDEHPHDAQVADRDDPRPADEEAHRACDVRALDLLAPHL